MVRQTNVRCSRGGYLDPDGYRIEAHYSGLFRSYWDSLVAATVTFEQAQRERLREKRLFCWLSVERVETMRVINPVRVRTRTYNWSVPMVGRR